MQQTRAERPHPGARGELAGTGILVNAVCPGWIATDMGGPGGQSLETGAGRVTWAVLLHDEGPGAFSGMDGSFLGDTKGESPQSFRGCGQFGGGPVDVGNGCPPTAAGNA
jgi:hypothetical protein